MGKETPEMLAAVKDRLSYNPDTGEIRRGDRPAFTSVNKNTPRGYYVGKLSNVQMYAHRVAWALQTGDWPVGQIDHINGDSLDNRWANLRDVTAEQNQKNRKLNRNNKSGVSGVFYWHKVEAWRVQIKHRGKMLWIGDFRCFFKAVKARKAAERDLGYHENHGLKRVQFDA